MQQYTTRIQLSDWPEPATIYTLAESLEEAQQNFQDYTLAMVNVANNTKVAFAPFSM